jgi:chaperone modulatory protein CbpM
MMRLDKVVALFPELDSTELTYWIDRTWVQPDRGDGETWIFHEIDIARVRLIYDLRHLFDTPEETIPIVLGLLDQVYELRDGLRRMTEAVRQQPPAVQSAIRAVLAGVGPQT